MGGRGEVCEGENFSTHHTFFFGLFHPPTHPPTYKQVSLEHWTNLFSSRPNLTVWIFELTWSKMFFENREEEVSRVNQPLQEGPLPGFCYISFIFIYIPNWDSQCIFTQIHTMLNTQHLGGYSQQDFYTLCRGGKLQRWVLIFMFYDSTMQMTKRPSVKTLLMVYVVLHTKATTKNFKGIVHQFFFRCSKREKNCEQSF